MLHHNLSDDYRDLQDKVILNVDDNEMNQLVLGKIMQNVGVKTVVANNGAEALKKLEDGLRPDVILMDIEMPVMNGVEACQLIKEKISATIPIIMNSGIISIYQRYKLSRLGVKDFLEKPYSIKDIYSKISRNLSLQPSL